MADTGPIRYLCVIGEIDLLPSLFKQVHIPIRVFDEMIHPGAPVRLRTLASVQPGWLLVHPAIELEHPDAAALDDGERAAISLAGRISADLLLMDDRKGMRFAQGAGFDVIGTLGILDLAARRGLIELAQSFDRLKATNFRYKPQMLEKMLTEDKMRR